MYTLLVASATNPREISLSDSGLKLVCPASGHFVELDAAQAHESV